MRNIAQINSDLVSLWKNTFNEESNAYAPVLFAAPKLGAIVFVGMNPSFSSKGWKSLMKRIARPDVDPSSFFKWPSPEDFDEQLSHELEAVAREHYSFFAPHKALSTALDMPWEHIDLFAYRETDQSKAKSLVVANESEVRLTKFGEDQFLLFEEVLSMARPTAVVVANALASQIYRSRRSLTFDGAAGIYRDITRGEHQFPVFFSGMLTGARALDRFSKDRLFWQIANALGKSWQPDAQGPRLLPVQT